MNILEQLIKTFDDRIRNKKAASSISNEEVAQSFTDLAKKTMAIPLLDPTNGVVTYPIGFEGRDPDFNTYLAKQNNVTGDYNDSSKWKPTGSTGGGSGITRSVIKTSSDVTAGSAVQTDYVYYLTGNNTLTLPTAVGNKNKYLIIRESNSMVSIASTGGQTFNGADGPVNLNINRIQIELISDDLNWTY